jgi:hypothetical protein
MKKRLALILMASLMVAGCGPSKPVAVDPSDFITAGNLFLKGIMQGQIQPTYEKLVSPGVKYSPQFSLPQFTADWQAIVEKYGALKKAELTEYQVVPGRKVVQLYYQVTHEKAGTVAYHLVAEMDPQGRRCTVFFIDIGNAKPYPPVGLPGEKKAPAQKIEVMP